MNGEYMKRKRIITLSVIIAVEIVIIVTVLILVKTNVINDKTPVDTTAEELTSSEAVKVNDTLPTEIPDTVTADNEQNVTYILSETTRDTELEKAIIDEIGFTTPDDIKSTRYYYNRYDLNDDGTDEVFVQLVGPYTSGSGGDTGLIFTQTDGKYKVFQRFTLIRNPIIISDHLTNGWHDIIVELSGGGIPAQQVQLQFDGSKYPNPSDAAPVAEDTVISGVGIIADDIAADWEDGKGLYLLQP
jgi:hypothetical protein